MATDTSSKGSVIVTAADEGYFPLLKGLVFSIRDLEKVSGSKTWVPIKVIDLGLSDASSEEIGDYCEVLKNPEPPLPLPEGRSTKPKPFLLSRAVKSYINEYFPGYEVYIWLDADTWVQNWQALELLQGAAMTHGFAVVPEIDRCYGFMYNKKRFLGRDIGKKILESFGEKAAEDLLWLPVMNSGVFSLRHDSPFWNAWRTHLAITFARASKWVSDQASFNLAVYYDKIPFHPLPGWCNWLCCHALPHMDAATLKLTEPLLPFRELGIVHLTGFVIGKQVPVELSNGETRSLRLDYLSLRALRSDPRARPEAGG